MRPMLVLGIESSCDETGMALYSTDAGGLLLAHALHSQVLMHRGLRWGGARARFARPCSARRALAAPGAGEAAAACLAELDAVAYTQGPGLAGALLVGAAFAEALATALDIPTVPVHHLEGHLLSPLLSPPAAAFSLRGAAGLRRP
jgi:N6-L-threonylcarbamoyladenine synthase